MELNEAAERLWDLHKRFVAKAGFEPGSEEDLRFLALAMGGEVGEVLNLVKKNWRGDPVDSGKLIGEMGDVLSYWLLLISCLGLIPAVILDEAVDKATRYIEKLEEQRALRGETRRPAAGRQIRDLTDDELLAEWHQWNDKIKNATGWGAAVGAADGFRRGCAQELRRRELPVPETSA